MRRYGTIQVGWYSISWGVQTGCCDLAGDAEVYSLYGGV